MDFNLLFLIIRSRISVMIWAGPSALIIRFSRLRIFISLSCLSTCLLYLLHLTTVQSIGPWSIFFGWIIGFVYHTTHINGLSIMNPFEMLPSSIPLSSITRTIEINLLESLGINEVPPPEPTYENGEYIL